MTPPHLTSTDWLKRRETQAVLDALCADGGDARVVGGAVRNALMALPVKDVDMATPLPPEEVVRRAHAAGLGAIPTGLAHGTVTVIANHVPFEVTTLRRDIETFGRHARVTFTTDWTEDARRRDFTINALYCARDGTVHDPLAGYPDIVARRVRFIGDAHERIREDYLRILRFFRFTAEYSGGMPDEAGLSACVELSSGLEALSGERIRAEMLRLLVAPAAVPMLRVMDEHGILAALLPGTMRVRDFERLAALEAARAPDAVLLLAALAVTRPGEALALRDRLKLSSAEYDRIARTALGDNAFDPSEPEAAAQAYIYRFGAEAFSDGAQIAWARGEAPAGDPAWQDRLNLPSRWRAPAFPVRGNDILSLGVPPGREVGRILSQLEEWWIAAGFPMDATRVAAELHRLTTVTKK